MNENAYICIKKEDLRELLGRLNQNQSKSITENKKYLRERNQMNEYELIVDGNSYTFYAPNDVIALLEIFYDIWDENLTISESRLVYDEHRSDFLEEIYGDFGCYPSTDDVIGVIENNYPNIEIIKNLDFDDILYRRSFRSRTFKENIKRNNKYNRNSRRRMNRHISPRMISKI